MPGCLGDVTVTPVIGSAAVTELSTSVRTATASVRGDGDQLVLRFVLSRISPRGTLCDVSMPGQGQTLPAKLDDGDLARIDAIMAGARTAGGPTPDSV
jgi:hypothetical protein